MFCKMKKKTIEQKNVRKNGLFIDLINIDLFVSLLTTQRLKNWVKIGNKNLK